MKTTSRTFVLTLLLLVAVQIAFGQNNVDLALSRGVEAVRLMDNGQIDESIRLLEEAQILDPTNMSYPYELGYAYYLKKDYKKSIKILKKLTSHKDVTDQVFQLLGNSYDMNGSPNKAIKVYDEGLKKFPTSGILYLEKGTVYLRQGEYEKALFYYEKGIEIAPDFPSNYYRAAILYCNSTSAVWGLLYGEIFMNLERSSQRTEEISKLLYDTYKNNIKFTSDTSFNVSFSQNTITISISDLKDLLNFKLPFESFCYEKNLTLSIVGETQIDINALNRIRTRFLKNYFGGNDAEKYPNILFDYQQKVKSAGHFDAYNYWILSNGDNDKFEQWIDENKEKWNDFLGWFLDNPLQVDSKNKFFRGQY